MKLQFAIFALAMVSVSGLVNTQVFAAPPNKEAPISRRMFVDPSSTKVSLGKISLIVNPLNHIGKFYVGEYQIKVVPYFFKNESGTLKMEASDDSIQKLSKGIAMEFAGKATNNKNGAQKVITGKATPSTKDQGIATFSIVTDNGLMVFNTSYHFGE